MWYSWCDASFGTSRWSRPESEAPLRIISIVNKILYPERCWELQPAPLQFVSFGKMALLGPAPGISQGSASASDAFLNAAIYPILKGSYSPLFMKTPRQRTSVSIGPSPKCSTVNGSVLDPDYCHQFLE